MDEGISRSYQMNVKLPNLSGFNRLYSPFNFIRIRPMSEIHPSALIGRNVLMGVGNKIGPFAIIEDGVKMGSHNVMHARAHLCKGTELGSHNEIHMGAVVGHVPQDLAYKPSLTFTRIGDSNQVREYVTIHRGTKPESATVIGNENYIMAYCHVAHNCDLGNKIIMVNQASLTGYCKVEDQAFLSGITGFHQFCRIGRLAMISALSACNKDIPPYVICGGRPAVAIGVNLVGLKRAGFSEATRSDIKKAYRVLYRSGLNVSQALTRIKAEFASKEVQHFVKFIEESKRGIVAAGNEVDESDDTLLPRKKPSVLNE